MRNPDKVRIYGWDKDQGLDLGATGTTFGYFRAYIVKSGLGDSLNQKSKVASSRQQQQRSDREERRRVFSTDLTHLL